MTRKMNKGMWLRQAEGAAKADCGWIIRMLCAMTASTMLLLSGAELTGSSGLYPPLTMILVSGCLCAVYGILARSQRQQWFYIGTLAIALLLILFFGRHLLNGICLFWNRMGDTWTAATGWVLPALETQSGAQEISLLVVSVFAGVVCAVVCCALAACRIPFLGALLPGLLFTGMILFRKDISFPYVTPLLLATVFLLIASTGSGQGHKISAVIGRLLLTAVVGIPVMVIVSLPAVQDWTTQISLDVQEKAHSYRYETQYTTLPEGDLSGYQESADAKHPALVVNMDTPEELYLRGFTGASFADGRWTGLDTAVLAENEDLLYWLNLMEFNPNAQYEQAVFDSEAARNTVTVQNTGACSRYLYVPFNLCGGNTLRAEDLNTDGVTSDAERVYFFSTVSGSTEMITQTLTYLQSADDEAVMRYRTAESAYRDHVYANYLQIPQEVTDLLQKYWNAAAEPYGKVEELDRSQAQESVLRFLGECFPEEGKQETIPLPLENLEGSSYQYATVAVLTLRYFGIPARYAEGYIITEKMAAEAAGSSIEVNSSCAGAWVEVYQDGLGWIPMDRLPGLEESGKNQGNSQDTTQKNPGKHAPEEGEELEEEPESKTEEPEPDGGYAVSLPQALLWGSVLILALLLLLILALVIRRRLCLKRRQKRFFAQNRNDAVAWIFADTALLLEKMGISRGNGSMRALTETIRQRFGDDYAESYETMVSLNGLALFSSREVGNENTESAMAFRAATVQRLKANAKWYQKIWMQWILCLY